MKVSNQDMQHIREVLKEVQERMIADLTQNFKLLDQGPVDDEIWYTIQIQNREIWFWLTQQDGRWSHHTSSTSNIPLVSMEEKVYLALVMRWS